MKYKSFKGELNFDELSHQHLSNIFWFNRIIHNLSLFQLKSITDQIDNRFGGITLEYKPHPDFLSEIEVLDEIGCLRWNDDKTLAEIWYGNEKVGILETRSHIRNVILDDIISDG